jgi:hypothetical protein
VRWCVCADVCVSVRVCACRECSCNVGDVCAPVADDEAGTFVWRRVGVFGPRLGDHMCGASVAVASYIAVVGCPGNDTVVFLNRNSGPPPVGVSWVTTPLRISAPAGGASNGTLRLFGASVRITDRYVVVGAPNDSPDVNRTRAGTVFVYRSPLYAGVVGTSWPPVGTLTSLPLVCAPSAPLNVSSMGATLAVSSQLDDTIIVAGAPLRNNVFMVLISEDGVNSTGVVRNTTCGIADRLLGFSITTERDVGSCVSFDSEMAYFGSPSADNSAATGSLSRGRMYAKGYCFPNRYLKANTVTPHVRTCFACPSGRFSRGGGAGAIGCGACPNTAAKPSRSAWNAAPVCTWTCNVGYFGPSCAVCGDFRANSSVPLLPPNASWISNSAACVWDCNAGFTRNASVMSLAAMAALPVDGLPLVDPAVTYCIPPPPPGSVQYLRLSSIVTPSSLYVTFIDPVRVDTAALLGVAVEVQDEDLSSMERVVYTVQLPISAVQTATPADTAALAEEIAAASGQPANYDVVALSFRLSGLAAMHLYRVRVAVSNAGGYGELGQYSGYRSTPAAVTPSQPGPLTFSSVSGGSIVVSWAAPFETGGLPQRNFTLCRLALATASTCAATYTAVSTASTFAVRGLLASTSHWFWVAVANTLGDSPRSAVSALVRTTAATPPSEPLDVNCTALSGTQINVTWSPPLDFGGVSSLAYDVISVLTSAVNTSTPSITRSTSTSAVVTGLRGNRNYSLQVRAVSGVLSGTAVPAERLVCRTLPATAPLSPSNATQLLVTHSTLSVLVTPPANDGGAAVSFYRVRAATVDAIVPAVVEAFTAVAQGPNGTSWPLPVVANVTGLLGNTTYTVTVAAMTSAGVSNETTAWNTTTLPPVPPTAPINLTFRSVLSGSARLSWTQPVDRGGAPLLRYVVEATTDLQNFVVLLPSVAPTSSSIQARLRDLTADTTYFFRVYAVSAAGVGPATPTTAAVRTLSPALPSSASVLTSTVLSPTVVTVVLGLPLDTGGVPLTAFAVSYLVPTVGIATTVNVGLPVNNTVNITGLRGGTAYSFVAAAANSLGFGPTGGGVGPVTTFPPQLPTPPLDVQNIPCNASSSSLSLSWVPPLDHGGSVVYDYVVRLSALDGSHNVTTVVHVPGAVAGGYPPDGHSPPAPQVHTVFSLRAGSLYVATVAAVTQVGESTQSAPSSSMSTLNATAPAAPRVVSATQIEPRTVAVTWQPAQLTGGVPPLSHRVFLRTVVVNGVDVPVEASEYVWFDVAADVSYAAFEELLANTTYAACVYTVNAAGMSPLSTCLMVTVAEEVPSLTPTAAPSDVAVATVGATVVNVSWTAVSSLPQPRYYVVAVAPTAAVVDAATLAATARQSLLGRSVSWTVDAASSIVLALVRTPLPAASTLAVTVGGLSPSTAYTAEVLAVADDAFAAVAASGAPVPFATLAVAAGAPVAPLLADVWLATTSSLTMRWRVVPSDGALWFNVTATPRVVSDTAATVRVSVSDAGGVAQSREVTLTALPAGTAFDIIIAAESSVGVAAVNVTASTNAPEAPSAPVNVTVTSVTSSGGVVTWVAPCCAPVLSYTVRRVVALASGDASVPGCDDALAVVVDAASATAVLQRLTGNTTYVVTVNAANMQGLGVPSDAVLFQTLPAVAPDAPSSVVVTDVRNRYIVVTVAPPADDGGAAVVQYCVNVTTMASAFDGEVSLRSVLFNVSLAAPESLYVLRVNGLFGGASYAVTVGALNAVGWSPARLAVNGTVVTPSALPPPPPAVVPRQLGTAPSQVRLQWSAPLDTGGAPVLGWIVIAALFSGSQPLVSRYGFSVTANGSLVANSSVVSAAGTSGSNSSRRLSHASPAHARALDAIVSLDGGDSGATAEVALTGLLASSRYIFSLIVVTPLGVSNASALSTVVETLPAVVPSLPQDLRFTALAATTATVEWSPPVDSGGQRVGCYETQVLTLGLLQGMCTLPGFNVTNGTWVGGLSPLNTTIPVQMFTFNDNLTAALLAAPVVTTTVVGGGCMPASSTAATLTLVPTSVVLVRTRAWTWRGADPVSPLPPWNMTDVATASQFGSPVLVSSWSLAAVALVPPSVPQAASAPSLVAVTSANVTVDFAPPSFSGGCNVTLLRLLVATALSESGSGVNASVTWSSFSTVWQQDDVNDVPPAVQPLSVPPLVRQAVAGPYPRFSLLQLAVVSGNDVGVSVMSPVLTVRTSALPPTAPLNFIIVTAWTNPVTLVRAVLLVPRFVVVVVLFLWLWL